MSTVTTWKCGVYHLLPMSHEHIEIRIKWCVWLRLLLYFLIFLVFKFLTEVICNNKRSVEAEHYYKNILLSSVGNPHITFVSYISISVVLASIPGGNTFSLFTAAS